MDKIELLEKMSEIGLLEGIMISLTVFMAIILVITGIVFAAKRKIEKSLSNMYLCKLANSDSSIERAMEYLELTNGIKQSNGAQINDRNSSR